MRAELQHAGPRLLAGDCQQISSHLPPTDLHRPGGITEPVGVEDENIDGFLVREFHHVSRISSAGCAWAEDQERLGVLANLAKFGGRQPRRRDGLRRKSRGSRPLVEPCGRPAGVEDDLFVPRHVLVGIGDEFAKDRLGSIHRSGRRDCEHGGHSDRGRLELSNPVDCAALVLERRGQRPYPAKSPKDELLVGEVDHLQFGRDFLPRPSERDRHLPFDLLSRRHGGFRLLLVGRLPHRDGRRQRH